MKYYFLAQIDIKDPEEYQCYLDQASTVFEKYKGIYLAVDKEPESIEGEYTSSRSVLIRFDTKSDFEEWYYSDDYQQILRHRIKGADCNSILIQGLT